MLLAILLGIVTTCFVFIAPLVLKRTKNINPTKNIFEDFVDNDHGYPWSWDSKRIKSYKKLCKIKKTMLSSKAKFESQQKMLDTIDKAFSQNLIKRTD